MHNHNLVTYTTQHSGTGGRRGCLHTVNSNRRYAHSEHSAAPESRTHSILKCRFEYLTVLIDLIAESIVAFAVECAAWAQPPINVSRIIGPWAQCQNNQTTQNQLAVITTALRSL